MFEFTEVLLENTPTYTCTVTCFGVSLQFKFTWVERQGKRSVTISNTDGDCYLQNTVLNVNVPLSFTSVAKADGFDFKLMLVENPMKDNQSEDIYNWKDNYVLYVTRDV